MKCVFSFSVVENTGHLKTPDITYTCPPYDLRWQNMNLWWTYFPLTVPYWWKESKVNIAILFRNISVGSGPFSGGGRGSLTDNTKYIVCSGLSINCNVYPVKDLTFNGRRPPSLRQQKQGRTAQMGSKVVSVLAYIRRFFILEEGSRQKIYKIPL